MKYLVITDIHANLSALEAVLTDAREYDGVWCLGDVVGYGPDPNECIQRVRELPNLVCLMGNHDAAVLGMIDAGAFNPEARMVIEWTRQVLTERSIEFLAQQPSHTVTQNITLVHASPRYPIWEYLLDTRTAHANFAHFETELCLVGHTHVPVIYSQQTGKANTTAFIPQPNTCIVVPRRAIANPGSVGQPRDRDPRSAYVIYDTEKNLWDYHRIEYDIPAVQARMKTMGLPERHVVRLASGW